MALTTQQLADALRLDAADAKITAQLQRIQPAAEAAVLKFAPQAPEAIRDEATIRLAGYLYDAPTVAEPGSNLNIAPLRASGAAGLLAPYRRHRLGITGAATGEAGARQPSAAPTIDEDAVNALITAALAPYATTASLNAAIAGIQPSSGGTGLTVAQAATLMRLATFEAGMKRGVILGAANASVTQAVSNASASIPGKPILPPNRFDREVLVTVGTFQGRFYIKDLENLGGVSTIGAQLTGSNAIEFTDSVAAAKYFISFHTTDRALLFASDTTDTYRITLSDYDIDLEDFARRSSAAVLPRAKAPTGFLDITHLERLLSLTNEGVAANDQVLFYDASAAPGTDQIREISFAQLDRRYAAAGTTGGGATAFTGLTDTPAALGTAGQHVAVNAAADALEFVAAPSGGAGATTFAGLTGRIAETQLPADLDDFLDALDDAGWNTWSAAQVATPDIVTARGVPSLKRSAYNANDITGTQYTWGAEYPTGRPVISTAQANVNAFVRVPNANAADVPKARLVVKQATPGRYSAIVPGADWQQITPLTSRAHTYYNVPIANVPGDEKIGIEIYDRFRIDNTRVQTLPDKPAGVARPFLSVGADNTPFWRSLPRGVRILYDGAPAGLTLTNLNSDRRYAALSLIAPAFDLDTAGNGNGEFHSELTLTMATRSAATIGFTSGAVASDASRTVSAITFASTLKAAAAFASASAPGGVKLAEANVYAGTTIAGVVILYLGRNANNEIGLFLEYDGAGAAASGNAAISARLELSFTPSDAPAAAAPAPSGGGYTPTRTILYGDPDVNTRVTITASAAGVIRANTTIRDAVRAMNDDWDYFIIYDWNGAPHRISGGKDRAANDANKVFYGGTSWYRHTSKFEFSVVIQYTNGIVQVYGFTNGVRAVSAFRALGIVRWSASA